MVLSFCRVSRRSNVPECTRTYPEVFWEKLDTLTRYFDIFGYVEPSQPTLNGDINNGNGCLNMSSFLVKAFTIISGVCSIAGFVVLLFKDKDKFFFAVTVYSVAITAFFIALGIMVYRALGAKFIYRPFLSPFCTEMVLFGRFSARNRHFLAPKRAGNGLFGDFVMDGRGCQRLFTRTRGYLVTTSLVMCWTSAPVSTSSFFIDAMAM